MGTLTLQAVLVTDPTAEKAIDPLPDDSYEKDCNGLSGRRVSGNKIHARSTFMGSYNPGTKVTVIYC